MTTLPVRLRSIGNQQQQSTEEDESCTGPVKRRVCQWMMEEAVSKSIIERWMRSATVLVMTKLIEKLVVQNAQGIGRAVSRYHHLHILSKHRKQDTKLTAMYQHRRLNSNIICQWIANALPNPVKKFVHSVLRVISTWCLHGARTFLRRFSELDMCCLVEQQHSKHKLTVTIQKK